MAPATIIIPLLSQNDAWLNQAVLSAVGQTVACEVLVISSPRTPDSNLKVLCQTSVRVLEQPPGTGFAAALNYGIQMASASRIGFLLSDDWLDPTTVETCLAYDSDIVSTGRKIYAANGKTLLRHLTPDYTRAEYLRRTTLHDRAHFLGHFYLFRKEALATVGGVDETLGDSPGVDDFDMIWCLLEREATVTVVEQKLYNYRDHEGERLTKRGAASMMTTFLRILDKHQLTGAERERLIREHSPWFGRSLDSVYRELTPWPVRKAREAWRNNISIEQRRNIQEKLIDPVLRVLGRRKG